MNILRHCRTILLLIFSIIPVINAQESGTASGKFPVQVGPTNIGRDFWLAFPVNWDLPGSTSYYIRLYITSRVRTEVKVWAGPGIKKVIYTIPNDIVTVDLTPIEAQMFVRNDAPPVPPDRIFRRRAVHVEAQAPIAVYGINHTTYTADGLLALPTSALGREYIVASYAAVIGVTQELPSQYMIIAPYNGTKVTITHPHRTPNHAAGETFTIDLDSGDVFSAMTVGYGGDMSGAVIRSNKPVAVTAGEQCAYIPNLLNFCCCDHIVEMMLPTESWGKVYHAVPLATRTKGDFYRVFAREPDTRVYVNGTEVAHLSGGGVDGTGWFEYRALGRGVVEFTADKPIYVSQYNPSQFYDNVPADPFYQVLSPLEQYQKEVLFSTPAADFRQNFVNLVCDSAGFYAMEITPANKEQWEPVWKLPRISAPEKFATRLNGKSYLGATIEIEPGTYRIRSSSPFAGNIYGFTNFSSYGYPISVAVGDLMRPDNDAPVITRTQSCDGTVTALVTDAPSDTTIRTNLATIELDTDPANTDNYDLTVIPFEAGVSQQTTYRLIVINKNRPARAITVISDMAGNITLDTVIYDPLNLTLLPSPQDYGKVRAGDRLTRTLTLTNESEEPATIEEILLKSRAQGFKILHPKGSVVMGPKGSPTASVPIEIEYIATIMDQRGLQIYEDSVGIKSCGVRYLALVKAQVVNPMIQVTDHDFGVQPAGVPTTWSEIEVRNISTIEGSTLTVSARSGPNQPAIFDLLGGNTLQLPFQLEPGQRRLLQIRFIPPAVGEYHDTIFFTSDAIDVAEGEGYSWLAGRGVPDTASSVERVGAGLSINSMEITPNPVDRDEAVLRYSLARRGGVSIAVVDAGGNQVKVLEQERMQEAGMQSLRLDLKELPAGVYFVRIGMGQEWLSRPLVIVR